MREKSLLVSSCSKLGHQEAGPNACPTTCTGSATFAVSLIPLFNSVRLDQQFQCGRNVKVMAEREIIRDFFLSDVPPRQTPCLPMRPQPRPRLQIEF